jgi:flagellar biosynthesis protein FliQ
MTVDQSAELARNAIFLALLIGAPVLLTAIVVGLIISILQAVTQIQDQTVSLVPKIVAMLLVSLYLMPWILTQMMEYSTDLFHSIPSML